MRILDLSAGNRAIWFNKQHPLALYLDIRQEMKPDLICDVRQLPKYIGDNFDLICWDPPHVNTGANSNMAKNYGHFTTAQIIDLIERGAKEACRVSKPNALMAFKWNTHDIKLKRVFDLMPQWEPLFGHLIKSGPRSQTYWVMFKRV